ncbi:MAG TPA: GMC oxidoreductase [Chthoniobacterales bacterium]|jgi:choline dehydrogenase-like flavoprotein
MDEMAFLDLCDDARAEIIGRCANLDDKFGRTHDIANLFICDGGILPRQGSANPGLTIQALATRTADYLISHDTTIFTSEKRDPRAPRFPRLVSRR